MNYDTMSVDEWLQAFFMAATCDGATFVGNEEVGIDEIKKELRKAVIREASVGVVELSHNGVAGDYDIVPRETP